jgi:hypothetical protein
MIFAFAATVALLVWMGFFMMGSLPLIILKHDTPMDARFIRGLFNVYYWAVLATATIGAVAFTLAGRAPFAFLMGGIALLAAAGRRWILRRMDRLRGSMNADDTRGISQFRRLHVTGMLLNVAQLGIVVVAMTQIRMA